MQQEGVPRGAPFRLGCPHGRAHEQMARHQEIGEQSTKPRASRTMRPLRLDNHRGLILRDARLSKFSVGGIRSPARSSGEARAAIRREPRGTHAAFNRYGLIKSSAGTFHSVLIL